MEQFKVIALSLGGLRNRIYSSGDVVIQSQLPVDVSELVAKGFLEPLDNAPKIAEAKSPSLPEPSVLDVVRSGYSEVKEWPSIDDMTVKEIKEALGDKAPKAFTPKAELYALLVG
jgi:hypothetical protein